MTLDINVTSTCNLGCKYCSEGHNPDVPDKSVIENSKTNVSKEEIDTFIAKSKIEKPNEPINISFWGGEPMMNMKLCLSIMTEHAKDNLVSFSFIQMVCILNNIESQFKILIDYLE